MDTMLILTIIGTVCVVLTVILTVWFRLGDERRARAEMLKRRQGLITKLDNLRASVQASLDEAERFWIVDDKIPNAAVATAVGQRQHDFEANKLTENDFIELCDIDLGGQAKFSDIPKHVKRFFDVAGRMGGMTIYRIRPEAYQPLRQEMVTLIALLEGAIHKLKDVGGEFVLIRIYRAMNDFVSVIPKPFWLIPILLLGQIMRLSRHLVPDGGFLIWVPLDIVIGMFPYFVLAGLIRLYLGFSNDK